MGYEPELPASKSGRNNMPHALNIVWAKWAELPVEMRATQPPPGRAHGRKCNRDDAGGEGDAQGCYSFGAAPLITSSLPGSNTPSQ